MYRARCVYREPSHWQRLCDEFKLAFLWVDLHGCDEDGGSVSPKAEAWSVNSSA